jgi:hypothetical protein
MAGRVWAWHYFIDWSFGMSERTEHVMLATFQAVVKAHNELAKQGVIMGCERAAQLAEQAWEELTSTAPDDRSAEWLDGCMAGVEKAAEIIRREKFRIVK